MQKLNDMSFYDQIIDDISTFSYKEYDILYKYRDTIKQFIIYPLLNIIYTECYPYFILCISLFFILSCIIIFHIYIMIYIYYLHYM